MKVSQLVEQKLQSGGISPDGALLYIGAGLIKVLENIEDKIQAPGPTDHPDMFQDIKDFHQKFKQSYSGNPRPLPDNLKKFRLEFMREELDEFAEALEQEDAEKQVDALFDLVYVAIGTCYLMGVDFNDVWNEGHSSNMSKECVAKGAGKMGFTVHKGKEYRKPDFKQFI